MARVLLCDLDASHGEAAFLVTFMESAEAKAFCPACMARTGLEIAAALLPAQEIIERVTAKPATAGLNGEEKPAARPGRKRPAQKKAAKPGRSEAAGMAEAPPPADDR